MSNAKILNENYISSSQLANFAYSSQESAAPATNVYDRTRRADVWRTKGYWNISSTNKTIIFRETVGVDLTANIAEAEYQTDSSFLTAIKTAFDAAGASTYTVTRDTTTNKIKITSDGLGGGGVFQLMWTDVLSTAATILGFSTAADDTGALTYTADTLKIHMYEFLKFDLGIASNPKAFVIVGERNTPINISPNAVIKIQGNSTDVWTAPEYEETLTYNEYAISALSTTGLHTSGLRYWRLYIEDTGNTNGYFEISLVYLGDAIEPTNGAVQFPFKVTPVDLTENVQSENGYVFSNIRSQTADFNFSWFNISNSESEEIADFLQDVQTAYPFFICLDPNSVFSTDSNRWVRYVRFNEMANLNLVSPGVWTSEWDVREEI